MNTQPSRPPFQPPNDCSQGFCSIYCPRWCYFIFPPPPPSPDFDASPTISPLLIVVIALAALALLLFGYYTTYKYWQRQHQQHQLQSNPASEEAPDSWASASSPGLDDSLIDRITVCKYRKGIEHTNCSVCLSDFNEDDNLRLLPKCTHAFHVECIDTWLKSNPNCPLCRASIVCPSPSLGPLVARESRVNRSEQIDEVVVVVRPDLETVLGNHNNEETSKGSSESLGSDAGREHHSSYSVVEISGDVIQSIR